MQLTQNIRLRHILTGNTGLFIKEYKPTGMNYTTQIKMDDGRIYFAPSNEFEKIIDIKLDLDILTRPIL